MTAVCRRIGKAPSWHFLDDHGTLNFEDGAPRKGKDAPGMSASTFVGFIYDKIGRPFKPSKYLPPAEVQTHLGLQNMLQCFGDNSISETRHRRKSTAASKNSVNVAHNKLLLAKSWFWEPSLYFYELFRINGTWRIAAFLSLAIRTFSLLFTTFCSKHCLGSLATNQGPPRWLTPAAITHVETPYHSKPCNGDWVHLDRDTVDEVTSLSSGCHQESANHLLLRC